MCLLGSGHRRFSVLLFQIATQELSVKKSNEKLRVQEGLNKNTPSWSRNSQKLAFRFLTDFIFFTPVDVYLIFFPDLVMFALLSPTDVYWCFSVKTRKSTAYLYTDYFKKVVISRGVQFIQQILHLETAHVPLFVC